MALTAHESGVIRRSRDEHEEVSLQPVGHYQPDKAIVLVILTLVNWTREKFHQPPDLGSVDV